MPKLAQISTFKSMRLVLFSIAVLLFVQCGKADLRVAMADVSINSWEESASVEYINNDTTTRYDMSIVLHTNSRFDFSDMELEVTMTSPDAIRHTERIALSCNSEQEAKASGGGDIEIPYRRDVKLSAKGTYQFSLRPLKPITGVEAAGINFQQQ